MKDRKEYFKEYVKKNKDKQELIKEVAEIIIQKLLVGKNMGKIIYIARIKEQFLCDIRKEINSFIDENLKEKLYNELYNKIILNSDLTKDIYNRICFLDERIKILEKKVLK